MAIPRERFSPPTDAELYELPRSEPLHLAIRVEKGDPQVAAEEARDVIIEALSAYGGEGYSVLAMLE